ncbi:MAG: GAF domain-containing protein [Dehalococcoidia bacterium]|nr:GAF domain-containing protein [Dehalococcoidia bacterium]
MQSRDTRRMNKIRIRFGIRDKILISFLALSLISVGIISSLALRYIGSVGSITKEYSASMGETVMSVSISALEDQGRRTIYQKAQDVAKEIYFYLQLHDELDEAAIVKDEKLKAIAMQKVGRTGLTTVYDKTGKIVFAYDAAMTGSNLRQLGGEPSYYSTIFEKSLLGGDASGYYKYKEPTDEEDRTKYMYTVPVEDSNLIVAASTYLDEFSSAAEDTKSQIASAVEEMSNQVDTQSREAELIFIAIIVAMVVVVSGVSFLLSETITRPIMALTKGSEQLSKGELDYAINVNTGDEMQVLAEQFNAMSISLKESYSNLEQKVVERTEKERERAEQLRTINEVSRKISSIVNLDELLAYVGNLLRQTFHFHNVNIFLFEPKSGKLMLKTLHFSGQKNVIPVGVPLEVDERGTIGKAAKSGDYVLVSNLAEQDDYKIQEGNSETRSELAVPVKMGGRVLGVLDIESIEIDGFDEADVFTAQTLADQLAVAIENARLYQETRQMAVTEERNRMAREIHDTLAQGFTGIILQLEATEQALGDTSEDVQKHLNQARSLARKSLQEARRSVWNLSPQALEQLRIDEAIKHEIDRFKQDHDVEASFTIYGEKRDIPPEMGTAIFRICQESLTNIAKHAQATQVEVTLNYDSANVELAIKDNGIGFDLEPDGKVGKGGGFGLISMRERAIGQKGKFEVQSEKGEGTLIKVSLPLA